MYRTEAELMASLGSKNIDCRQDGARPSIRRSAVPRTCSTRPIEGIEQADALLIVGSNPRLEAALAQCPHSQALAHGATSRSA
jgi:NADH-quinone oxidoreductase subunit G